ncbi:MAG: 5'-methylthioadenosine/S-adenosylhomocysteine nucleosidase [Lachnospiraceae bacterium]|nr:5'-methylthioadenosine/S-adenosylhomocysteine nucleosidase [Lachnospiraceae bacterium]
MKVGIICAGDTELAPFLPIIQDCVITEKAMLKIYEGKIADVDIVTLFSGVCKVNAAIATQILIDTYHVDMVINAGVAGGMDPKLDIFDTVISTEVAYHDVHEEILTEFHPWMENVFFKADKELLKLSEKAVTKLNTDYRIVWGRMVTGEAFITDEGRDEINGQFATLTVDMETGSIAHVCYVNQVPFIAIRSITDTPSHSGSEYFEENCEKASVIAKEITVALLAEIRDK